MQHFPCKSLVVFKSAPFNCLVSVPTAIIIRILIKRNTVDDILWKNEITRGPIPPTSAVDTKTTATICEVLPISRSVNITVIYSSFCRDLLQTWKVCKVTYLFSDTAAFLNGATSEDLGNHLTRLFVTMLTWRDMLYPDPLNLYYLEQPYFPSDLRCTSTAEVHAAVLVLRLWIGE